MKSGFIKILIMMFLILALLISLAACKNDSVEEPENSALPGPTESQVNIEETLTELPYDINFPDAAGLVTNNQYYRIIKYENPYKWDKDLVGIFYQRECKDGKLVYTYCLGQTKNHVVVFKHGLMNENFIMITEHKYDKIHPFDDGCAVVMMNNLYGVVNSEGILILDCKYDKVPEVGLQLIRVETGRDGRNRTFEYFDKEDGESIFTVEKTYNAATRRYESYILGKNGDREPVIGIPGWDDEPIHAFVDGETNLWGYMDKDGNILAEAIFQEIHPFCEGRAVVKLDGKYGYVNEYGELFIEAEYDMAYGFTEGMARVLSGRRYGFIDDGGNLLIDCKYVMAGDFGNGLAAVRAFGGEYNYIDAHGEIVISGDFADAGKFSQGYAPVQDKVKGRYRYIDTMGNTVFNLMTFDSADEFNEDGYALAVQRSTIYLENLELGGTDWTNSVDDVYLIYIKQGQ
jgi:hypothetical protein